MPGPLRRARPIIRQSTTRRQRPRLYSTSTRLRMYYKASQRRQTVSTHHCLQLSPKVSLIWSFFWCSVAIVFAQIVVHYDQAPTVENSPATNVQEALPNTYIVYGKQTNDVERLTSEQGPTVFSLLFASVIGCSAHTFLLWRLERGERIEILDILATSTSLTSTITPQFQLRRISTWGTILVAIWALSSIGN